jgi:hypothetical protein
LTTPGEGPGSSVTVAPKADYVINLNTGAATPLPDAIIRSLGEFTESGEYAVSPGGSKLAYAGTGKEGSGHVSTHTLPTARERRRSVLPRADRASALHHGT